jgi:hypothetical protein
MCPMCIATVAWIAAGATSTGGVSAVVVSWLLGRTTNNKQQKGEEDGQQQ